MYLVLGMCLKLWTLKKIRVPNTLVAIIIIPAAGEMIPINTIDAKVAKMVVPYMTCHLRSVLYVLFHSINEKTHTASNLDYSS